MTWLVDGLAFALLLLCAEWYAVVVYDLRSRVEPEPGEWGFRERARFIRRLGGVLGCLLLGQTREALDELYRLQAWMAGHRR